MKRHVVFVTLALLYWLTASTMAKAQDLPTVEPTTVYRVVIDGKAQTYGDVAGPMVVSFDECEALIQPLYENAYRQIRSLFPESEIELSLTHRCRRGAAPPIRHWYTQSN